MDKATVEAVLFAAAAVVAAYAAVKTYVFKEVRALEVAVALAATGLFVVFTQFLSNSK